MGVSCQYSQKLGGGGVGPGKVWAAPTPGEEIAEWDDACEIVGELPGP